MKKGIEILLIIMLFLAGLNDFVCAGNKATITVMATVLPRISQTVFHQEKTINITEIDIKREFVEVPSGTILQIRSNNRKGYGLFFEGSDELFKEVWVIEIGRVLF